MRRERQTDVGPAIVMLSLLFFAPGTIRCIVGLLVVLIMSGREKM